MSTSYEFELRLRADGDGWTLLRGGIAIAGGSFQNCVNALQCAPAAPATQEEPGTPQGDGETPLTDAQALLETGSAQSCIIGTDFARSLERRLSAALAEAKAENAWHERFKRQNEELREELAEAIARGKKERDGAMHSSETWELMHAKRHEELEKSLAELAEARLDTERLDWLSRECFLPSDHPDDRLIVLVPEGFSPLGSFTCNAETDKAALRKAIDRAREQEGA